MTATVSCPFAPWDDPTAIPLVVYEGVSRRFGAELAVDHVSLSIYEREFFVLLGPSGCGKTTLMRMLAGFETPDDGRVLLGGQDLAALPPHRRPVNMMFQSYALFPHMSVAQNVAFGLQMEGLGKAEQRERTDTMLRLVRMTDYADRKPHQLSGGQRQRVALARSLAKQPKVLLLDEPLGALDRRLREDTQFELVTLQEKLGMTFIVVTHDQDEAMTMATRIAVMDKGRVAQVGPPSVIYEAPATRYVAGFVGDVNMVAARIEAREGALTVVSSILGIARVETSDRLVPGQSVWLAWRPEKTRLVRGDEPIAGGRLVFQGPIEDIGYRGDWTTVIISVGDARLKAGLPNATRRVDQALAHGEVVRFVVQPEALMVLDR